MKTTLPKIKKGNVRKLIKLLRDNADDAMGVRFNLGLWGETSHTPRKKSIWDCQTTACAMGLAAISGAFADLGFKVTRAYYSSYDRNKIRFLWKNREHEDYMKIATRLFGMTEYEAHAFFTFGGNRYTKGPDAERELAWRLDYWLHTGNVPMTDETIMGHDGYRLRTRLGGGRNRSRTGELRKVYPPALVPQPSPR